MTRLKLYTAIFVVLLALSTTQALLEMQGLLNRMYWTALTAILVLSTIKAVIVAAYYQHLRWEPRAVSYLMLGGVLVALALTSAAAYSIL